MKGDIDFLNQIIDSMIDALTKLEKVQQSGNVEEFNKTKLFILELQKKLSVELS